MLITLSHDRLAVTLDSRGAELRSVRYCGRERLWQNENGSWAGHAPILFPVCGASAMRLGGRVYPCPRHGFARTAEFSVVAQDSTQIRFRLSSDRHTRELYPYDFCFDVIYTLTSDAVVIAYEITNPGERILYASCGGHDSFALQEDVAAYEMHFEAEEHFDSYLTDGAGHLTGETASLGNGRVLDLATPLLDGGGSVCLDRLRSRTVALVQKATRQTVARVNFPDTEKMVLWHPPGAKMLCIEPWQTLPDAAGSAVDFTGKDGVLAVAPGQTRRVTRRIAYGDAR